jgi:hypothetical protein
MRYLAPGANPGCGVSALKLYAPTPGSRASAAETKDEGLTLIARRAGANMT